MSNSTNRFYPATTKIDGASFNGKKSQQIKTGQWGSAFLPGANNTARGVNATEEKMVSIMDSKCARTVHSNNKQRAKSKAQRRLEHENVGREMPTNMRIAKAEEWRRRQEDKKFQLERLGEQLRSLLGKKVKSITPQHRPAKDWAV